MSAFREIVPAALDGERLDRFVAMVAGCSRSDAASAIDAGSVSIDGRLVTQRSRKLRDGESVEFVATFESGPPLTRAQPDVEFAVVHEDDDLLVVDKPAGLVVHPGAGHPEGTLVNGLLARYPELAEVGQPDRPGIVHRLDRGTSGLMAVARTQRAYDALVSALQARDVARHYKALVWGHQDSPHGVVDAPIGRSSREPTRMAVSADGREARTHYEVDLQFSEPSDTSLLWCRLETGRTHQIRVHLAAIGHPVVGDQRYGGHRASIALDRPFLHAARLGLAHPVSGAHLEWTSQLPADLSAVLAALR